MSLDPDKSINASWGSLDLASSNAAISQVKFDFNAELAPTDSHVSTVPRLTSVLVPAAP